MSQEPTYLVLNHFDQEIPEAEKSLIKSFNKNVYFKFRIDNQGSRIINY